MPGEGTMGLKFGVREWLTCLLGEGGERGNGKSPATGLPAAGLSRGQMSDSDLVVLKDVR